MKISYLLISYLIVIGALYIFGTEAYTSISIQRNATLNTASDSSGMIELTPYGSNGIYLISNDSNGTYMIEIDEIPVGILNCYYDVFKIINNTDMTLEVFVTDEGPYNNIVYFAEGSTYIEVTGKNVSPGEYIYIDIYVDASNADYCEGLLSSFDIICKQNGQDAIQLYREASMTTAPFRSTLILYDHSSTGLNGGTASYYDDSWHTISGSTDSAGEMAFETCSNFTQMKMTYHNTEKTQTYEELISSNFTWQTVQLTFRLLDHLGSPLQDGDAYLNSGEWTLIGTTGANGEAYYELFEGSCQLGIMYNDYYEIKTQSASSPAVFQTGTMHWDGTGATPLYYQAQSWHYYEDGLELMPKIYSVYFSDETFKNVTVVAGQVTNFNNLPVTPILRESVTPQQI